MAAVDISIQNGTECSTFAAISIPNMEAERTEVANKIAEINGLIKQLEDTKMSLQKSHVRGDQLPQGVALVWEKDLEKYHSERNYNSKLNYYNCPQDTWSMTKCNNCKVFYKSHEERTEYERYGNKDTVSWQVFKTKFPCPSCGSSN
eukprot:TRINITY_DN80982_c0_g1_i1.p1 TRINITY_DN80982_c0_g1~~TRINITY_DN80982_c0_g1_i1.p1  ORF type:complete len:147 (-),score=29.58 TRINITY_DN80982_c0_g1_i1:337-777(-)